MLSKPQADGRIRPFSILAVWVTLVWFLTACGNAATLESPGVGPSQAPITVAAERGDVVSTLVLRARVVANAEFVVTAPFAGRYAIDDGAIRFVSEGGEMAALETPEGVLVVRSLIEATEAVPRNYPLAVGKVRHFALVAELGPSDLYRLYSAPGPARGQIDEGPGPFDCPLADPVPSPGRAEASEAGPLPVILICVIPWEERVFEGMSGVIAVETGTAQNAVLLPIEAVAGSAEHGEVTVLSPDGEFEVRQVTLGISDGARIEIVSGITTADVVVIPAPALLPGNG